MSDSSTTTDDERERTVEHLTDALDADDCAKKEFHIREALQLLNLEER